MDEPLNEDTVYIDHLSASNQPSNRICESKIIPNIFFWPLCSRLLHTLLRTRTPRGPASAGKFNNSFLSMFKSSKRLDAWLERAGTNMILFVRYLISTIKKNKPKENITFLKINDHVKLTDPKDILEDSWGETERFFKSNNRNPNGSEFIKFSNTENVLSGRNCKKTCEAGYVYRWMQMNAYEDGKHSGILRSGSDVIWYKT